MALKSRESEYVEKPLYELREKFASEEGKKFLADLIKRVATQPHVRCKFPFGQFGEVLHKVRRRNHIQ